MRMFFIKNYKQKIELFEEILGLDASQLGQQQDPEIQRLREKWRHNVLPVYKERLEVADKCI